MNYPVRYRLEEDRVLLCIDSTKALRLPDAEVVFKFSFLDLSWETEGSPDIVSAKKAAYEKVEKTKETVRDAMMFVDGFVSPNTSLLAKEVKALGAGVSLTKTLTKNLYIFVGYDAGTSGVRTTLSTFGVSPQIVSWGRRETFLKSLGACRRGFKERGNLELEKLEAVNRSVCRLYARGVEILKVNNRRDLCLAKEEKDKEKR